MGCRIGLLIVVSCGGSSRGGKLQNVPWISARVGDAPGGFRSLKLRGEDMVMWWGREEGVKMVMQVM